MICVFKVKIFFMDTNILEIGIVRLGKMGGNMALQAMEKDIKTKLQSFSYHETGL
jgi:hypothetical protein